jgi:hypothetical protein
LHQVSTYCTSCAEGHIEGSMVHAPWCYMQCYECYEVLHDVGSLFNKLDMPPLWVCQVDDNQATKANRL